ncbi:MAG TPA: aldehyde dehydrogenase family protein, partial [Acidimicrobiales bacterium]|nr:aldehyde dehydrogenase family protein [Acidimicrobiales bacterium]
MADSLVVRSPFDGSEVGTVPSHTGADVDAAVASAKKAFDTKPMPAWKRAEILDTAARLLRDRTEEFARTIAMEAAKPIKTAR